jgi:hypothetical protein
MATSSQNILGTSAKNSDYRPSERAGTTAAVAILCTDVVWTGTGVSRHGAKRPPSKAELRRELERATRRFISDGGEVEEVPAGTSVYAPGTRPPPTQPLFTQPRETRTPLNDVAAALDARRAARKRRRVVRSRKPEPRRQVIYDDFGEPLRRVWSDD